MAEENVYTIGETISNSGRALVDMERGKVYDFSEFKGIQFVSGDLLFTWDDILLTLYKINLNDISAGAIPLNNPMYNAMLRFDPAVLFNNKIIGYDGNHYVFDINNTFPPQICKNAYLTPEICSFGSNALQARFFGTSTENQNGILIQDLEGSSWYFTFNNNIILKEYNYELGYESSGPSIGVSGLGNKYFIGKISIDDSGQIILTDCIENDSGFSIGNTGIIVINNNGVSILTTNGIIKLKKKTSGIQIDTVTLTIPDIKQINSYINNKDNCLYYIDGYSIKRLYLATDEIPEIIYTNNRLLSNTYNSRPKVIGDELIFYQYADDNISVNTYSLPIYQANQTPKILSTSYVDIENIIELDF
jgi:hypothetical protein